MSSNFDVLKWPHGQAIEKCSLMEQKNQNYGSRFKATVDPSTDEKRGPRQHGQDDAEENALDDRG
ncbi:hypothetical protein [Sphingopyxis witflariensis]|uniref:hypothetical protein n=1 Tax=Sphingopyxis witflariensis TaxID=173675 RepID=UPI001181AC67|nr:hypothetical protein [Sphingopyxis witflariensis]